MKIVLWIGNESNQMALANKINSSFPLAGIVTESRKTKRKITASILLEKIIEKIFLREFGKSWNDMKKIYTDQYFGYPATKTVDVENINSQQAYDFTKEINPDLIIVSGTRLVKEKMLSLRPNGIINLHTGLSPYIKGGPNCTNWCIATKQYHLIGNTIMWIDKGIDSGNILTTELTEFNGSENLTEIHIKVMEHAHALCLKAIEHIAKGSAKNIKQSEIGEGTTYYTKQWGLKQKFNLIKNIDDFRHMIKHKKTETKTQTVKTIKL